jgi:hypothetical protein
MIFDVDGFLQSTEFLSQLAALISAVLSAIVSGYVSDFFGGV